MRIVTAAVHVVVPGIHHNPSWPDGWTDRAVEWTHDLWPDCSGEKFEYFASFIFRRFGQKDRAVNLAALLAKRANRRVILTGHSNGTDVIVRALKIGVRADVVNLIAPACERDFWKSGLNAALRNGRVGKVNIWISEHDSPMKLARLSKRMLGWAGLGYGTLGIDGPANIAPEVRHRVSIYTKAGWGHGSYFEPENFDGFMEELKNCSQ